MTLQIFNQINFLPALKALFKDLKVPMNYVTDEPTTAKEILKDTYKENDSFQLIDDVYFVGIVDDAAFVGNKSFDAEKIKSDYDGILIFGVTLKDRPNALLPTRSQLAEISRAFNREFYYTPVVVVFRYGNHLAFANTERLKYKQEWREGEKAGKVSLLRDINIEKLHSGHERILAELQIPNTGTKKVDSFAKLYAYWQEVFSVSLLNKKFYQELSNWYFWATQHVTFPGEPTIADAHHKNAKLDDLLQEHKATNVIRMLTRLLFVWFIKEKKLIPEELFELNALQKDILNEISPYHDETSMFKGRNKESIYYKAILQNLFFATLNCPIKGDSLDKRKRGFRGDGYGTHRGIDYLMRYKTHFKNPAAFLKKLNDVVPFLNGGLFECLDDKFNNLYVDGFSDQMTKGEQLIVPDYLFFGLEEETDLSDIVGISDKKYKQAAVKGLINILKSYKFTITENTPIEEDVALDPELLGKVFENLLASYNPETKTTARKQTGSFYTPREIVNYMVDESLIAYLKNAIKDWRGLDDETLDKELHVLTSFDSKVPFEDNSTLQKEIITALSTCTILDPACGSGAFPMGILQKMVHILQKLDPENKIWKEVQLAKAEHDSKAAFEIEDKQAREERLLEINEAFDQSINDPDYARKLFLIENCIYGLDIQPIATQISKLRFFISLVVEQKVTPEKDNFGIRPLPNLETKFVAANTLISIEKSNGLFETDEVKQLENELKIVRHKIFSLKSKERKIAWREKDKQLREKLSAILKNQGLPLDAAEKLAKWDPYDQNAFSPFFDTEWMFGIKQGFDVVIGNPPWGANLSRSEKSELVEKYPLVPQKTKDTYLYFLILSLDILKSNGTLALIIPNTWLLINNAKTFRRYLLTYDIIEIDDYGDGIFEQATVESSNIFLTKNKSADGNVKVKRFNKLRLLSENIINKQIWLSDDSYKILLDIDENKKKIIDLAFEKSEPFSISNNIIWGIKPYQVGHGKPKQTRDDVNKRIYHSNIKIDNSWHPFLVGKNVNRYTISYRELEYIKYGECLMYSSNEQAMVSDKILIRQTSDIIRAAFDDSKHLVQNSLFIVYSTKYDLRYLTALLNSQVLNFIYKLKNPQSGKVFAEIKPSVIKELPIVKATIKQQKLVSFLVSLVTNNQENANTHFFESIIESCVFNLYFPNHMKESVIDIIDIVQGDIDDVMQDKDFESLNDIEKKQVIEQLHTKWSHPDNEVRNRIKLFAVRSPEILKPILES